MYRIFFKRLLDIVVASVALLAVGWLMLIIALWLHFANKGAGAFFVQTRVGKGEKWFHVLKFKSMTDERDAKGDLLPDAQRLTTAGRFVKPLSVNRYALEKYGFMNELEEITAYVMDDVMPVTESIKNIVSEFDRWVEKYGHETYK